MALSFLFCVLGREHPLEGASPLDVRRVEVLVERKARDLLLPDFRLQKYIQYEIV